MRRRHDRISKYILEQALLPEGTVVLEKTVSAPDERRFDLHFIPGAERPPEAEAAVHMRLLRRMTRGECLMEVFSTTPGLEALRLCASKHLDNHSSNRRDARKHKRERPRLRRLWVLSPGRPEGALRPFRLRPAVSWPRGYYRSGDALRLWVVVLAELPPTRETLLLRLLGNARLRLATAREILALPESDAARRPLLRALSHVKFVLDRDPAAASVEENELMSTLLAEFERHEADVFRRGVQHGEARGEARSILAILAARGLAVAEEARKRILSCEDVATLDRWLMQALTTTTAEGIFHSS